MTQVIGIIRNWEQFLQIFFSMLSIENNENQIYIYIYILDLSTLSLSVCGETQKQTARSTDAGAAHTVR